MSRLAGRVALVTGSSRGIGAAIARRLAADGARVVLHARAQRDQAEAVAETIRATGGTADVVMGDLAQGDAALDVVRDAFAVHGALDVLVLNAGGGKSGMAADMPVETIDAVLALNLRSTILAASEFARLTQSEAGRVIFLSSGMATHGAPGVSIAAAAKAGARMGVAVSSQEVSRRHGCPADPSAPTRSERRA